MTRTEIAKQLSARRGSDFLSLNDICKSLAIGKAAAYNLLEGLDYIPIGNSKKYFALDVAARIVDGKCR